MDNSISQPNRTMFFEGNSISSFLDESSLVGYCMNDRFSMNNSSDIKEQQNLPRQQQKAFQRLSLDWQLLDQEPILLQQTAKLLSHRSQDPVLKTLSALFIEGQSNKVLGQLSEQEEKELTLKEQKLIHLKQLQQKYNTMIKQNDQRHGRTRIIKKQNRCMIYHINELKAFVKQMATDRQHNPFAKINDQSYLNSLRIVSEINQELGKLGQYPKYQNDAETLRRHNETMIQQRNNWIPIAEQLNKELENLIQKEQTFLQQVKQQIKQAKRIRQSGGSEIIERDDSEINIQIEIIPYLIEKTITQTYTCDKDCQKINKSIDEYLNEIHKLSRTKNELQVQLKHSQSIVTQKIAKHSLLQKQNQQLQAQIKKLQSSNQPQALVGDDQVNYEGLVFKTYEHKENLKRNERLNDNLVVEELPKPAKRILVQKQTLSFTQKFLPFIKNYKQLVNWAIAFWILVICLIFTGKVLLRSGVLETDEPVVEFQLPDKTVVHTIQTKHKTQIIKNESNPIDMVLETILDVQRQGNGNEALLEYREKPIEQVNYQAVNEETHDWKKKILEDFQ